MLWIVQRESQLSFEASQTLLPGVMRALVCLIIAVTTVLAQPAVAQGANTTLPLTYPGQVLQGYDNQTCPPEEWLERVRNEVESATRRLLRQSVVPMKVQWLLTRLPKLTPSLTFVKSTMKKFPLLCQVLLIKIPLFHVKKSSKQWGIKTGLLNIQHNQNITYHSAQHFYMQCILVYTTRIT